MIQYIYFVKCPNCEDEHFDFFDDAKAFALGCLGDKPVITQVEVCRNDFGECTDSVDHGIQWSWEDEVNVTNEKPDVNVFTKGDLAKYNPDADPEFAMLDNSIDYESTLNTDDTAFHSDDPFDHVPDNFRKPVPEGMTIKELVEEMEKNEDDVECTRCNELFDKSECRYEVDLGWLCHRCEAAIKSRGETLTFSEGNFLDESAELEEAGVGASKYNFKYFVYNENVEADIYTKLNLHPATFRYVSGTGLSVPLTISDVLRYPPYKVISRKAGTIIGFKIDRNLINFIIEDFNSRTTYEQDFKTLMKRVFKGSATQIFLNAFYQIATEVNKESNRGVSGNRDFNAYATVRDKPAAAEELKSHIVKVQYNIPCDDYIAEDLMLDDSTTEADAEKAAANLARIKSKFFDDWKYGYAADEAGLVTDRTIYNDNGGLKDSVYYIATEWHPVGKITFDCRVDQLSKDAQDLIRAAKVKGDFERIKNKKEIDCIRLAFALTEYFDDVKFYEHAKRTALVASAAGDALK